MDVILKVHTYRTVRYRAIDHDSGVRRSPRRLRPVIYFYLLPFISACFVSYLWSSLNGNQPNFATCLEMS